MSSVVWLRCWSRFEFLLKICNYFIDKFKSIVQRGNHLWVAYCVVLLWLQNKVGSVDVVCLYRQVVELSIDGTDGMDEVAIVMVGGGVVCAESV